jgi:L-lactate dehydrogenase complex protein LldE
MRVALAVPCYMDQFRPSAARATLALLERLGCEVSLALDAPCCGQPMANVGATDDARAAAKCWAAGTASHDHVVMPSGSCVHHVRRHLPGILNDPAGTHAARVTWELCEFIAGPLNMPRLAGTFSRRVAVHLGCHAQRGLRLGGSTELHESVGGPMHTMLAALDGITLVRLERRDECCGFGGSFSVGEPELSAAMGRDRLRDYAAHDAEVLVSSDVSCLMHMESLLPAGSGLSRLRTLHVAELLEEATR